MRNTLDKMLAVYTGDRARPETVRALDPLSAAAFDVLEGFRERAQEQKEDGYLLHGNQERVQASFLNDFLAPAVNNTHETEAVILYDTLNRILEYTCRDKASVPELYIFMDIAKMLPGHFKKAQAILDSTDRIVSQGKEVPDTVALIWGRINGMITDQDNLYKRLDDVYDKEEQNPKAYNLTAKRIKKTAERLR